MTVNLDQLMTVTPESLAKLQHDTLKKHFLQVLESIQIAIEKEKYDPEKLTLFASPSGDGWGLDSTCIDFGYEGCSDPIDIGEALQMLNRLKNLSTPLTRHD
jgi:hypothetical protein